MSNVADRARETYDNTASKAKDSYDNTASKTKDTYDSTSSKAKDAFDSTTTKARDTYDSTATKAREKFEQGKRELGRMANDASSGMKKLAAKNNLKSPLPTDLSSEAAKAADILKCFAGKNGIPREVIHNAKGLAIFTVVKAGIFWTGRAGSGIVIARTHNGGWSAPSCISVVGVGFGAQGGLDVTNFVVILNTDEAVKAFSRGGNVTLGGNLSISAGPIGFGTELSSSIYEPSALYSYSWSKGFFAGVSVEGTVIMQRKFANKQFYNKDYSVAEILNGKADPSNLSDTELYEILEHMEGGDIISNK